MSGRLPSASTSLPCLPRPVMVPIASKKLVSKSVKISSTVEMTPILVKAPTKFTSPTMDRSGMPPSASGFTGAAMPQSSEPVNACTMNAITVVRTMAMKSPPGTFRMTMKEQIMRPMTKTSAGQVEIDPLIPRLTGTVVCAASGTRVTNPPSTRPIMAMNMPMPTPIAAFIDCGMASKTAVRKPEMASRTMMMPSMTTRPMDSCQVSPLVATMLTPTKVFIPKPAAMAKGYLAMAPKRIDMTPATSAVAAATCGTPSA